MVWYGLIWCGTPWQCRSMSQHVAAFRSHNLFLPRHATASFLHSCWLLHVSGWAGTAKLRATRVARAPWISLKCKSWVQKKIEKEFHASVKLCTGSLFLSFAWCSCNWRHVDIRVWPCFECTTVVVDESGHDIFQSTYLSIGHVHNFQASSG
jgi:hypothetical protein